MEHETRRQRRTRRTEISQAKGDKTSISILKLYFFLKVYKHSVIERVEHCISFYSLKHKKQSFDHTKNYPYEKSNGQRMVCQCLADRIWLLRPHHHLPDPVTFGTLIST